MIVLDTHVWVWWVHQDDRLSSKAKAFIAHHETRHIGASAISCWEVAKPRRAGGGLGGGQLLKRWTGIAGEEVEYAAGGRAGSQAASGKGAGVADEAHHPGTPPAKSGHRVERLRHGRQFAEDHLEFADV